MKKSFLITLLGIVVAGVAIAQSEETRSLSSFSRVSAHEGVDVYLKEGNKEEARVVSDDIDLEDVLTDVRGDQLKIHLEGSQSQKCECESVRYLQITTGIISIVCCICRCSG